MHGIISIMIENIHKITNKVLSILYNVGRIEVYQRHDILPVAIFYL